MGQRKGFKVTDAERKVRVGIAVEHLADLKKKTIIKFKLPEGEDIFFQTRDGIPIRAEDEFLGLPAQTLLIWVRKGERAETDAEILYRTIREVNFDFLTTGEKVAEFFTEQMKSNVYSLAKVLKEMDDDKAKASTKEGDPDWFQGERDPPLKCTTFSHVSKPPPTRPARCREPCKNQRGIYV